jgi:hypothetical protein
MPEGPGKDIFLCIDRINTNFMVVATILFDFKLEDFIHLMVDIQH